MLKVIFTLVLTTLGAISFNSCAAQDEHANQIKRHLHGKGKTKPVKNEEIATPVRNEEWYLDQVRASDRFKAAALGNDGAEFSPRYMMVDHLVQQATISNHPIVENNKDTGSPYKNDSSLANSNKITFMIVPPVLSNKLMDLQKRPDIHPTVTFSWKN